MSEKSPETTSKIVHYSDESYLWLSGEQGTAIDPYGDVTPPNKYVNAFDPTCLYKVVTEKGEGVLVGEDPETSRAVAVRDDGAVIDLDKLGESKGGKPLPVIVMGKPWLGTEGDTVIGVAARYKITPPEEAKKPEVRARGESPVGKVAAAVLARAVEFLDSPRP